MERFETTVAHFVAEDSVNSSRPGRAMLIVFTVVIAICAGLLVYSQTMAFVWDEGFHLLAAQLIAQGRTPYIDFCFPQTPLNAYWNAAWMLIFGQGWRVTHIAAALLTAGAVFLMADYVFRSFPVPLWRHACALVVAVSIGFNVVVVEFGTIAQAYGIGLFLTVAAFRAAIRATAAKGSRIAFLAGLLAGAAASSTLLTVIVIPVLLGWLFVYSQRQSRWARIASFAFGTVIPFAPVIWFFVKAPRQVVFNVIQYQALFRRVRWTSATSHDIDVLSAWLDSAQALILGGLAIAGIWFVSKKSNWERVRRSEFYLCGWLSLGLILYIAVAHPTFQRYFIFVVPFASVLAATGFYFAGALFSGPDRPLGPAMVVCALMALSLARTLFDDRDSVKWSEYEQIAAKVDQVTPPMGNLYADEQVYFLTRRPPPSGMEFSYSHKLDLPPAQESLFHIISDRQLGQEVKAGEFDTVQSCNDDRIEELNLVDLYGHKADIGDCSIFWGKKTGNRRDR